MEATDTIPMFLIFGFQGCNAPALSGGIWTDPSTSQVVRPVMIPFVLMSIAAVAMMVASLVWWREMAKSLPMALIAIAFVCVAGFLIYQGNDFYQADLGFDTFLGGGGYFLAVGEFSFYLLGVATMVLVSFILVWREVGWETERNLLFLTTGSTVLMAAFWVLVSFAVWNCV